MWSAMPRKDGLAARETLPAPGGLPGGKKAWCISSMYTVPYKLFGRFWKRADADAIGCSDPGSSRHMSVARFPHSVHAGECGNREAPVWRVDAGSQQLIQVGPHKQRRPASDAVHNTTTLRGLGDVPRDLSRVRAYNPRLS